MSLKHAQNAAGDQAVGIEADGVFVPLASVSANRIAQLVERGKDLKQKAGQGDEAALEVLNAEYVVSGSSGAASGSEPEGAAEPQGGEPQGAPSYAPSEGGES